MKFQSNNSTGNSRGFLSKSPIYSSKIRQALTPPGKFRTQYRSPTASSPTTPTTTTTAGVATAGEVHQQQHEEQPYKRSVNFESDQPSHLSDKYAPTGDKGNVPDSPPPPPKRNSLQWGALERSLNQQVLLYIPAYYTTAVIFLDISIIYTI